MEEVGLRHGLCLCPSGFKSRSQGLEEPSDLLGRMPRSACLLHVCILSFLGKQPSWAPTSLPQDLGGGLAVPALVVEAVQRARFEHQFRIAPSCVPLTSPFWAPTLFCLMEIPCLGR